MVRLRTLLALLFIALAAAAQTPPPTVSGVWLGTLAAGPQTLRIQFHLQPDITGPGACVLDSIDQGAFGIPCQLAVIGNHVDVKVPAVSGGWSGTLGAGGNSLTGTWSQGGGSLPLNLARQQTAIPPKAGPKAAVDPALPPVPLADLQGVLQKDLTAALDHGALAPATHAGITVGVVQHGQRRILTYGTGESGSVFEIGSITKTFTGLILAQMTEQGLVRLDTPVRELLPPGIVVHPGAVSETVVSTALPPGNVGNPTPLREITLLDLSDQHSGLPRIPDNFHPADPKNPYADYNAQRLYEFITKQGLALPSNAPFGYSNVGVGLLGQALANRAKLAYPELLRQQITGPLGMHDTAIQLTPAMRAHLIQGYDGDHQPTANWDFDALAGAGGIRSTAADMLTYLEAQLHPERLATGAAATPQGKTLAAALAASHVPRVALDPDNHIALNWFLIDATGTYWHNGGTGGYSSMAMFNPGQDFALIVLSNTSPGPGSITDALGYHIAQRLSGKPAVSLGPLS